MVRFYCPNVGWPIRDAPKIYWRFEGARASTTRASADPLLALSATASWDSYTMTAVRQVATMIGTTSTRNRTNSVRIDYGHSALGSALLQKSMCWTGGFLTGAAVYGAYQMLGWVIPPEPWGGAGVFFAPLMLLAVGFISGFVSNVRNGSIGRSKFAVLCASPGWAYAVFECWSWRGYPEPIPSFEIAFFLTVVIVSGLAGSMAGWSSRFSALSDPRRVACQGCGYDLRGNKSGRCPECGLRISTAQPTTTPSPNRWSWLQLGKAFGLWILLVLGAGIGMGVLLAFVPLQWTDTLPLAGEMMVAMILFVLWFGGALAAFTYVMRRQFWPR